MTTIADLAFFAGRLHPLVVHLPIGMLLLVAVLELVGWRYRAASLPPAVRGIMLIVAAVSAAFAAACGWLLARDGGYDPTLLERHRWLGVATAGLAFALLLVRRWSRTYAGLLLVTLLSLALAGHDGGSLTHGSGYLADAAPRFIRPWIGGRVDDTPPVTTVAEADVFLHVVQSILAARCGACHGATKADGELRLDSYAHLMEGGKSGRTVVPGDAGASLLLRRLYLPLNDKKHMPPAGKPQPSEADLALLGWWIEQGAAAEAKVADLAPPRDVVELLAAQLGLPPPPLPDRAAMVQAAQKLEQELGIVVRPLDAASPWLAANARLQGANFGDAQLAALRPIAPALHRLDLGSTAVTDAGLAHLAAMTELRRLQLDGTAITNAGLVHLQPLTQLESLNLHTTQVSDEGLVSLRELPRLRRLFLWQTEATPAGARELAHALENRHRLQSYRDELAALQSRLASETFQSNFGVEPTGAELTPLQMPAPDQPLPSSPPPTASLP